MREWIVRLVGWTRRQQSTLRMAQNGPSDGRAEVGRGNVAWHGEPGLKSATCRYDTQRDEGQG